MTEAVSLPSVISIWEIEPNMIPSSSSSSSFFYVFLLKKTNQKVYSWIKRGSSMIMLSDDDVIEPPRVHVFIAQDIISWSFFFLLVDIIPRVLTLLGYYRHSATLLQPPWQVFPYSYITYNIKSWRVNHIVRSLIKLSIATTCVNLNSNLPHGSGLYHVWVVCSKLGKGVTAWNDNPICSPATWLTIGNNRVIIIGIPLSLSLSLIFSFFFFRGDFQRRGEGSSHLVAIA